MRGRFLEPLEARCHWSATPGLATSPSPAVAAVTVPAEEPIYNPAGGVLRGQFTSRVPFEVVGGSTLDLSFRVTNTARTRQRGLIDLTYVLTTPPTGTTGTFAASSFDPRIATQHRVLLNVAPRGTQTFRVKATIPFDLPSRDYLVAVAVDKGGAVATGIGFQATIGAAVTTYVPAFSEVVVETFNVSFRRVNGILTGRVNATLRNFGNSASTGPVTVLAAAARSQQPSQSDVLMGQQTLQLAALGPGKRQRVSFTFEVPGSVQGRGNFFVRISMDREQVARDVDADSTRDRFTRSSFPF